MACEEPWFDPLSVTGVFAEKKSPLPAECFSQTPLFIGRFNHLSFEDHFPTSEMLVVREGEKACDVDLAKTQVRKSIVLG